MNRIRHKIADALDRMARWVRGAGIASPRHMTAEHLEKHRKLREETIARIHAIQQFMRGTDETAAELAWDKLCADIIDYCAPRKGDWPPPQLRWNRHVRFLVRKEDSHEDRLGIALRVSDADNKLVFNTVVDLDNDPDWMLRDLSDIWSIQREAIARTLKRVPRSLRPLFKVGRAVPKREVAGEMPSVHPEPWGPGY